MSDRVGLLARRSRGLLHGSAADPYRSRLVTSTGARSVICSPLDPSSNTTAAYHHSLYLTRALADTLVIFAPQDSDPAGCDYCGPTVEFTGAAARVQQDCEPDTLRVKPASTRAA